MLTALKFASKLIPKNNNLKLGSVLSCHGANCVVATTDLTTVLYSMVPMAGDFEAVVDPKAMTKILANLKDAVSISVEGTKVRLISGQRKLSVNTVRPVDEMPEIPALPMQVGVSFSRDRFLAVLQHVANSVSHDECRRNLMAVKFEAEDNSVKMISTDGSRLHKDSVDAIHGFEAASFTQRVDTLVPVDAIDLLLAIVKAAKVSTVTLDFGNPEDPARKFVCRVGNHTVVSTPVNEQFPKWESVVPCSSEHNFAVAITKLQDTLKLMNAVAEGTSKTAVWHLRQDVLTISHKDHEANTTEEILAVMNHQALDPELPEEMVPEIKCCFNNTFVLEALAGVSSATVEFGVSDELAPCIIKDPANSNYLAVVMPVRL